MAVVIYWYDTICFAIVGVAMLVSVYVLWRRERPGGRMEETILMYRSLLVPRLDNYYNSTPVVNWSQLWCSCWRGLHPGFLLAFRLTSFFLLAAFLSWDIHVWGTSIFIYYTEWTFVLVMLYFAIGSVISAYGCWLYCSKNGRSLNVEEIEADGDIEESRSRKAGSNYYQEQKHDQTLQRAGFWGYLMQIVYQTCAGAVILTDVVFWGIIVPLMSNARLGLNLLMGCMHTVNIVLLLVDTSINGLVPVCGLIMIIPAAVALKLITNNQQQHHLDGDDVSMEDLWVPCWSNLNPKWLLVYRALAFVTMSYILYQMLLFAGLLAFYFYTQWTFTLVILYFAVATAVSAQGCFMSSHKLQPQTNLKHTLPPNKMCCDTASQPKQGAGAGFLGSALLAIYQTSAGASILTDLVFWCILMPLMSGKDFQLTLVIACIHSLNAVFLIIDSLLNALVAISLPGALNSVGASVVSWNRRGSHSVLWALYIDCTGKKLNLV
ncbi:hypothetical protein KSS87_020471 [Heliosperma pusillum]|nr:hypothetical protein KSS87_020471 [Heliosperma pusillum]